MRGWPIRPFREPSNGRLLRSRDINAPKPPLYATRPNPALGVVRQVDASARQRGDSLQTTLRGRAAKWFNGQIQYSLSRPMNNSNGLDWYPSNDWNPAADWARADFDRRHRLLLLGTMTAGRQINIGVALTVQSGLPYSELAGVDPNHIFTMADERGPAPPTPPGGRAGRGEVPPRNASAVEAPARPPERKQV